MKTIRFLCIAIFGVCYCKIHGMLAGNGPFPNFPAVIAEAPVVDFNTIFGDGNPVIPNPVIPEAFQPKRYDNPIAGAPNRRCVYFTVINNGPDPAQANFQIAQIGDPNPANEHNIYFPADGSQPTTPDAVKYSCANVEDEAITEWYMKMFGVIPINQVAINEAIAVNNLPPPPVVVCAGWRDGHLHIAQYPQGVISFDASVDGTMVNDPNIPGVRISRRALFEREFRKIASTSVGRVLLYRILIEIRRQRVGKGVLETNMSIELLRGKNLTIDDIYAHNFDLFPSRNICRSISINWQVNNKFSFRLSGHIDISNTIAKKQTLIYNFDNRLAFISLEKSGLDEDLFHEMCHWYHYLRDPSRFINDVQMIKDKICKINDGNRIGSLFYGSKYDDAYLKLASVAWCSINDTIRRLVVNFEEMRTILGSSPNCVNYLEGDDISENLYILINKYKNGYLYPAIRFGHMDYCCVELLGPVFTALMNSLCTLSWYEHTNFLPIICVNKMLPCMYEMKTQKCGAMYPENVQKLAKKVI